MNVVETVVFNQYCNEIYNLIWKYNVNFQFKFIYNAAKSINETSVLIINNEYAISARYIYENELLMVTEIIKDLNNF